MAEDDGSPQLAPLFITEFVLELNSLTFLPDREEFHDGISEVLKRFQQCVLSVLNLVPDSYFDAFTRYSSASRVAVCAEIGHHVFA